MDTKSSFFYPISTFSVDNVEHILKLADEYEMKLILDLCTNCLRNEPKTEYNAMKILLLAQKYRLENFDEDCKNILSKMKLQRLERCTGFAELNGENVRGVLLPRMRRLEEVVKELSPQVAGLVACTTWLWHEAQKPFISWCPSHIPHGKSFETIKTCLKTCPVCKSIFTSLALCTVQKERSRRGFVHNYSYTSRNEDHFDTELPNILEKLFDLAD